MITTRNMTIVGIAIGVLIVVFVAVGQLGNKATGRLSDPGFTYPAELTDGATIGAADAPVTMEVFEDYQCPVCARYSLEVEPSLVNKYVKAGVLRIVHNDIAILGTGGSEDESKITATGAFCANEQGLYWPYAHWIYNNQDGENQGGFNRERVAQIAVAAGVEEGAFNSCQDSEAALTDVATASTDALNLGISSTPTMRINGGELLVGLKSAAELGALIEAELANAGGTPSASPTASP